MRGLIILLLIVSCSKVPTIGKKTHRFGEQARAIIWLQVPGLSYEHLNMLKFDQELETRSEFEKMTCQGRLWAPSALKLRPLERSRAMSQFSGSKIPGGKCSDLQVSPFWALNKFRKHEVFILENGNGYGIRSWQKCLVKEEKILNSLNTKSKIKKAPLLSKEWGATRVHAWVMARPRGSFIEQFFHHQRSSGIEKGLSYDQSCQSSVSGECHSSLTDNVVKAMEHIREKKSPFIFIIRDHRYLTALRKKNISKAREILNSLELTLKQLRQIRPYISGSLLLVSSSQSRHIEFPNAGASWRRYESSGRGVIFKRNSLVSPIMAEGAQSENFCGTLSDYEIADRLLWRTLERQSLLRYFFGS